MKKVLALALAAVMIMALCGVAFAAADDNVSVTVTGITEGNTLKLYKIAGVSVAADNTLEYTMTSAITLPTAYDTIDKIGAVTGDDNIKAMANAFGAAFAGVAASYSDNADSSEEVTLAVAPGYYYGIVEGTANSGIVYKPMLINAVPVANPTTNTYDAHADISVAAKSEPVTIEKTEDQSATNNAQVKTTDNYSVGDTIHFTITTVMPNYPSNATKAKAVITDTPTGLDDDYTTVTVNVGGTDYTEGFTVADTGKGFTVTFTQEFILAHPGEIIIVEYNAVLEAVDNVTATSENTATITYNTNPYVDSEVEPGDTDIQHNYGVYVYKFEEGNTDHALPGAKFILVKANAAGTGAADPSDPDNIVGAEATTDDEGHVAWEGLKAGTYYVIETSAPAGYRLDSTPHAVVLSETDATDDNPMTTTKTEEYYNKAEVPNTPGASLPSTGGIGTTIFYVAGLIMVLGAATILIARRKADAE